MRLIGLIGQARVGKDTVAEYLHEHHLFNRRSFAAPMKDMLEVVFGDRFETGDREQPIDWLGKSPRHLMQTLGTEWGRNCVHPELWVMLAEREWQVHTSRPYNRENNVGLVITDVRFHNEADMILRNGGTLIHVVRDTTESVNPHASEQHTWDNYPMRLTLDNNGTLPLLYSRIDRIMANLSIAAWPRKCC
jgi:hypothetical protein